MGNFGKRFIYGMFGAFLGAIIALLALFWFDQINWTFIAISAAICFVVSFFLGKEAIEILKELAKSM